MAVVLELACASESWRLSQYRLLGLTPPVSVLGGAGWGLITCISNMFPSYANAAGWGPHFENY